MRQSFAKVESNAVAAAQMFYNRLFEIEPSVRILFRGDLNEQGDKLMAMIKAAVAGLDDIEALAPIIQELGVRHKAYGVQPAHYGPVAEALLWTLEQGLGDGFTPDVKAAWVKVYAMLAETMIAAADAAPEPAPAEVEPVDEGPVSRHDIELVQQSFAKVEPIAEAAAQMFYNQLFELDPSLRDLFKGDMKQQGRKLMEMIKAAVVGLDDIAALVPVVQQLGVRHGGYGVQAAHYGTVAEALLWTLEQGLGDGFTPEVKAAWVNVYTLLAETMIAAAVEASA